MTRYTLIIILIFNFNCFSQTTIECQLVDKGAEFYNNNELDSALYCWKDIFNNYPDTSFCYRRAVSNIFNVFYADNQLDSAITWGNYILQSNFNDYDPGWRGITQRFANYHYWTSVDLAFIYEKKSDIDKALQYTYLADTLYEYKAISATSFEKEEIIIAFDKANFYLKKGDKENAIWVFVSKAIDTDIFFRLPEAGSLTYLDFYSGINKDVIPLIEKVYGKRKFYKNLIISLDGMKISNVKIGSKSDKEALLCTFVLYGKVYRLGSTDLQLEKGVWKEKILNSSFGKAIK